jgi:catechol 2,3-dioxygenase
MSAALSQKADQQTLESHRAPIHVASVSLRVRDLDRVARFYCAVLGLQVLVDGGSEVALGNDGVPLLTLIGDTQAAAPARGAPGLFHTAFVLPERRDLALWLRKAIAEGWRVGGASDHLVSEAIYLDDPEGNGIEIYRDRPRAEWPREGGDIRMATLRLDVESLLALAPEPPATGAYALPAGARIGHVHLSVAALPDASRELNERWGFDEMCRYPGAIFFATGGYHHHLAGNVWQATGVKSRDPGWAGLDRVTLQATDRAAFDALAKRWRQDAGAEAPQLTALGGLNFALARP